MPNLSQDLKTIMSPPPAGDIQKAEKYLSILIDLIKLDKLTVLSSNLGKTPSPNLEEHYRLRLLDYEAEVSHSLNRQTNQENFICLFTNTKMLQEGSSNRVVLAFIHLTKEQFLKFKQASQDQINKKLKEEEEKRFKQAMVPIDSVLEKMLSSELPTQLQTPQAVPKEEESLIKLASSEETGQDEAQGATKENTDELSTGTVQIWPSSVSTSLDVATPQAPNMTPTAHPQIVNTPPINNFPLAATPPQIVQNPNLSIPPYPSNTPPAPTPQPPQATNPLANVNFSNRNNPIDYSVLDDKQAATQTPTFPNIPS